ncbi:MAG: hypothetical protein RIB67_08385 [Miltoncostaeaceae bacterium]
MSEAAREALAALRVVEHALTERHPEGPRPHPLSGRPDAPAAAVFRHGDALSLISLDVRGEGPGEWSLGATAVLALAGAEIDAALEWVNERNRRLSVGKYYCAHSREAGVAAIAYDTWVQGAAFGACSGADEAGGRLATVLLAMVANVLDTGAAEAAQAAAAIGGRPPGDSEADRQALLVIALG